MTKYRFPDEFEGYNFEVLSEKDRIEYLKMSVSIKKTKYSITDNPEENMPGSELFFAIWGDWLIEKLEN